jgi:acetylglutamate kinase
VYCFEKNGVLQNQNDEKSVIRSIKKKDYLQLKEKKVISTGMIPKMDNAIRAIENSVSSVQIGNAEKLLELINEENYEGTRLQYSTN